jgi:hypothetical protein
LAREKEISFMTIIARGSKQVYEFEQTIGGKPSKEAVRKSRAALQREVAERVKAQREVQKEMARLAEPFRELIFGHIPKDDPKLRKSIQATKTAYEQRSKHTIKPPKAEKFEARVTVGSIQAIKVPPYDDNWSFQSATNAEASADKGAGTYHLAVQSIGNGSLDVAAGVGIWFFAPAEDPQQRVAALLDFSDDWWDSASGYVAHNDLRTRLWIWGDREQRWMTQTEVSPEWSDGVGWFESHGNDPQGDSGRLSVEAFFPASANGWYEAWVWSDASVYADSGIWGLAASSIHFDASVPFVVFGSL